ncbi:ABC transporter transmembrane domain-containing protein [Gordonia sp. (in: high G+C Gram-positive bacteria)]|uniref:ABC transporter transmembrane domain-containing protein n=1 Tax=Gordonia sp. (in: high G+C Gram-positive bacteria) TaxID=84139 RepID=UPI003C766141
MKLVQAVRMLKRFLGSDWRLSLALVLAVLSAAATIAIPFFLAQITNIIFSGVIGGKLDSASDQTDLDRMAERMGTVPGAAIDWSRLWMAAGYTVAAIVVLTGARVGSGLLVNSAVANAIRRIRERVEHKVHRLPVERLEGRRRGEVLNAMTVDVDNLATVIGPLFVQLPVLVLTMVAVAVALLLISPFFAMIAFATIPVTAILGLVVLRYAKPHMERQWQTTSAITAHVEDVYSARHDLRLRRDPADSKRVRRT